VTAWPRALAASALVTTEQESKLPAATGADGEDAAAALVTGALGDELGGEAAAEAEEEEEEEEHAVSKAATQPATTAIATGRLT
jgi:hypothetical protein